MNGRIMADSWGFLSVIGYDVKTSHRLRKQHKSYAISGAEVQYSQGHFGWILLQKIQTSGCAIYWLHAILKATVALLCSSHSSRTALYGSIEGSPTYQEEEKGKLLLPEGWYGLYAIPAAAENKIQLPRGSYDMVVISLPRPLLDEVAAEAPLLKPICLAIENGKQLPPLSIEAAEIAVFTQLRHCLGQCIDQGEAAIKCVRELLLQYLNRQKKNIDKYPLQARQQPLQIQQLLLSIKREQIQRSLAYIYENYHIRILTTSHLAKTSGMSADKFVKIFKEVYGVSPKAYLRSYRLKKAAELLTETDMPMRKISRAIGYGDPVHFAAVFERHFGVSMQQYRLNPEGG